MAVVTERIVFLIFSRIVLVMSFILFSLSGYSQPDKAPEFEIQDLDGGVIKLSDYNGKVVYLDFWASWCGPCKLSFPWMEQMYQKYGSQDLAIIAVNLDQDRKLADRFLAQAGVHFIIGFDPGGITPLAYEIKGMPSSVIINRDGTIFSQRVGFNQHRQKEHEASIEALVSAAHQPLLVEKRN
ncbi:MAG: TlpA disulfide reductase family protein [bacterium]